MKRLFAALLIVAAALASAPGIAGADNPQEITVAYFQEWPTANQVAQAEQWYDEAMGVKVNWRAFESGTEMAEAMVAGDVQIAYSMGAVPFAVAVSRGAPLKAVGVAVSYAENDNCVVYKKAAIDKANAHELEGKKVAVPMGTVTHYKMLRTLDHLGVDASKLDLVDMVSADAAKAFIRGELTMACGWGGPLRRMKGHGWELMTAEEQEAIGIRVFDVIAVTNDFAEKHPDLVTKFLEVTDKAILYLEDNPDEAQPIIAEAAGMELKESNIVLSLFQFPRRDAQLSEDWMGGGVQSFLKQVADFYVKQDQIPASLDDYGPTVDASFYQQVQ
jgi:taurine transport system substrate-binding protein